MRERRSRTARKNDKIPSGPGDCLVAIEAYGVTDLGQKRTSNEDCLYLENDSALIMVFDGMGGHRAGDVASRLAMDTMVAFYKANADKSEQDTEVIDNYDSRFGFHTNLLRQAAVRANLAVLEASLAHDDQIGMGSTVAGMLIHEHTVSMINVGDSRMYLIRDGAMEQISRDHTLAEDQVERGLMSRDEADASQLKHILSSVIGVDGVVRAHMDEIAAVEGDVYFLCTDGLTSVMDDEEILEMIIEGGANPESLNKMIEEVNERGGPDNTTLAIAVYKNDSGDTPD
jgi:serine/threonine protein phosphatase PrpC